MLIPMLMTSRTWGKQLLTHTHTPFFSSIWRKAAEGRMGQEMRRRRRVLVVLWGVEEAHHASQPNDLLSKVKPKCNNS